MKKIIVLYIIFLSLLSCEKHVLTNLEKTNIEKDISSVMVPLSRLSLFADISDFDLCDNRPITKTDNTLTTSLESLLDFDEIKTKTIGNQSFTVVPFLQNKDKILASIQSENKPIITEAAPIKKYYILMRSGSCSYQYIATLITSKNYSNGHQFFDFFDRPNYSGVILYSTFEGRVFEVRTYNEGKIIKSDLYSKDRISVDIGNDLLYISLFKTKLQTKGNEDDGWNDEIEASISIGHRSGGGGDTTDDNWNDWIRHYEDTDDDSTDNEDLGGGGGNSNENDYTIEEECTVCLSCDIPDRVEMFGDGRFTKGSYTYIDYREIEHWESVQFKFWTGAFEKQQTASFIFQVLQDVVSTAYFEGFRPCRDTVKNISNPLMTMKVAASNSWTYIGGTFGETRYKKVDGKIIKKNHYGLDIAADVGTALFAMKTGVISKIVDDAPDTLGTSYGNQLWIDYIEKDPETDKESTIRLLYAHLNYGTPIANNPRTNKTFKVGDVVFQGDLIGYSGRTGNAYNVLNYHLHLGVLLDGKWVDPIAVH